MFLGYMNSETKAKRKLIGIRSCVDMCNEDLESTQ
jgi:hypothetical protein